MKFDGQDQATNAVVLGQADAMSARLTGDPVRDQAERSKLEQAGDTFDSAPYGWPVKKGSPLAASLQKALEHLIQTGDNKDDRVQLGCRGRLIDKPVINGADS